MACTAPLLLPFIIIMMMRMKLLDWERTVAPMPPELPLGEATTDGRGDWVDLILAEI